MNPDLRLAPEGSTFDEYVEFVRERHLVWERRSLGLPAPWSASPILREARFTNDFRVLDTGSQYVLRMVQDAKTEWDVVLRAFLYRFTNLPDPWEAYHLQTGRWPRMGDVVDGTLREIMLDFAAHGGGTYRSAYVIAPPNTPEWRGRPVLQWLLWFVEQAFTRGGSLELRDLMADPDASVADKHAELKKLPRCGDFLALQVLTDIGYSDLLASDEDEFVVVGPGSRRGLQALGLPATSSAIRELHAEVRSTVTLDVHGTPRPLSLMDVQNTLCEFGKYHAMLNGRNPRRRFTPDTAPAWAPSELAYPNHWS